MISLIGRSGILSAIDGSGLFIGVTVPLLWPSAVEIMTLFDTSSIPFLVSTIGAGSYE